MNLTQEIDELMQLIEKKRNYRICHFHLFPRKGSSYCAPNCINCGVELCTTDIIRDENMIEINHREFFRVIDDVGVPVQIGTHKACIVKIDKGDKKCLVCHRKTLITAGSISKPSGTIIRQVIFTQSFRRLPDERI